MSEQLTKPKIPQKVLGFYQTPDLKKLSPMRQRYVAVLDKMPHLDRAKRGRIAWNAWAQAYKRDFLVKCDGGDMGPFGIGLQFPNGIEGAKKDTIYFGPQQNDCAREDGKGQTYDIDHSDFQGFIFPGRISFRGATFTKDAYFGAATFTGRATFWGATFTGSADFGRATFTKDAYFGAATFIGSADFGGATFTETAYFVGATFTETANFGGVTFTTDAYFGGATFTKTANFWAATFTEQAIFLYSLFGGSSDFSNVRAKESVNFHGSVFLGESKFSHSVFKGYVDFDHCRFGTTEDRQDPEDISDDVKKIRDDILLKFIPTSGNSTVPNFVGTNFQTPPNLGYTKIPAPPAVWPYSNDPIEILRGDFTPCSDLDQPAKFRRLKELAADGHNHLSQNDFFREELLSKRGRETTNRWAIMVISLFETFSRCGTSFLRPLSWWVVQILLFMIFYSFSAFDEIRLDCDSLHHLADYSAAQSVPFLGILQVGDTVAIEHLWGQASNMSFLIGFISTVQSLIGSILLFLALLAVRNYFKLR